MLGNLQVRIELFDGLHVAQRHQRPDRFSRLPTGDGLHARDHSRSLAPAIQPHFYRLDILPAPLIQLQRHAQGMPRRKNFRHRLTDQILRRRAQIFFHCRAYHHRRAFVCKKNQPVVDALHHMLHVFAQRAEDFLHAVQLLPDLADLAAHLPEFVRAAHRRRRHLALRDAVQLRGNFRHRRQRHVAHQRRQQRKEEHDRRHRIGRRAQHRINFPLHQRGIQRNANFAEGLRAQIEQVQFQNSRWAIEDADLLQKIRGGQLCERSAALRLPPGHRCVARNQRHAVQIGDGHFVDRRRITERRFDH